MKIYKYSILLFSLIFLVVAIFIVFNKEYFNYSFSIDSKLAAEFGNFFGGFIGTIFSILSVFLLIYTILSQNIESAKNNAKMNFFKMIDFHNENVKNYRVKDLDVSKKDIYEEGRKSFVILKIQLKRLLEIISKINDEKSLGLSDADKIDIAYICFYYGQGESWVDFIKDKLKYYENGELIAREMLEHALKNEKYAIHRSNQTGLSSYFRNMFNAIKIIDEDKFLSLKEKKELMKIYRALLSNPELYILFFNLVSRFDKKWVDYKYIEKYDILRNLPKMYCDGYDPSKYFDIRYEDDDIHPWAKG